MEWTKKLTTPETVLSRLKPGMSVFISTGMSEPRTLVESLMTTSSKNLSDLELIQLVSFGNMVSESAIHRQKFRLRTFFLGYVVTRAVSEGRVDLIPARFARIPPLFETGRINVDAALIQVSPPDRHGYCSLGVSIDVARLAMEKACLVAGEICPGIPRTFGDTFVPVDVFDCLVESVHPPLYFKRWPVDETLDRVAARVAALIEDRDCIAVSIDPLCEALSRHLVGKRNLGVHTPVFTDALMDLVTSGAVTNRYKSVLCGKCMTSYAFGTPELMDWLDQNPMVDFQGIGRTFDPAVIGQNDRMVVVIPARKVDLSGRIVLHTGIGNIRTGPVELFDFLLGARISRGGRSIFGLPSRNRKGEPNIAPSVKKYHNLLGSEETVDFVVTEYGVASLRGLTVRERAQSLIDIAHPEDRKALVEAAKAHRLIYQDQIFLPESSLLYPEGISENHTLKAGLEVRFRPIRPSDEENMRRLFYRFSDESVYLRYFSSISVMDHNRMQAYVNIDWNDTMALVGTVGDANDERIIAEGRYLRLKGVPYADLALLVDEEYQSYGVCTCLLRMLMRIAQKRGVKAFIFDVMFSNFGMMRVARKVSKQATAVLENGVYSVRIPID